MTGPVPDCRFCLSNRLIEDGPIHETGQFYVLMSNDNQLPRAALVIPKRHSANPFEMNTDEWSDLPNALAAARESLEQFTPAGFTLGWNVGPVAGQTVGHTHLHVIARFEDDPMAGHGLRHPLKRVVQEHYP